MSDNKKYYYMKLKEDFFDSDAICLLESMENGLIYSNILLKLYCRGLRNEGRLAYNNRIPYNSKMIAQFARVNIDVVEKCLVALKELELIEILDNGAIYMNDIQNFIGESSTEADRIRAYRKRISEEKSICTNVQQMYDDCTTKVHQRLEIRDKRLDIRDKDIYIGQAEENKQEKPNVKPKKQKTNDYPFEEIVNHLNSSINAKYKATTPKTQELIKARFAQGFTLDDFKAVIDKKSKEWLGSEFEKYLRPETLFGVKFENYLNQSDTIKPKNSVPQMTNFKQRKYSDEEFESFYEKLN